MSAPRALSVSRTGPGSPGAAPPGTAADAAAPGAGAAAVPAAQSVAVAAADSPARRHRAPFSAPSAGDAAWWDVSPGPTGNRIRAGHPAAVGD